jgi:putative hemolysin
MILDDARFEMRLARDAADLRLAQALRYEVFVAELGADGPLVDHTARLEADRFDPFFDHLMLFDRTRAGNPCVGVTRMMRETRAREAGQFYCDDEYDLGVLRASGRRLLELGRSCLHPDYRGGTAMAQMWSGLAAYVEAHGVEVIFGVASFHGTDVTPLAAQLSFLHHRHLAPPALRVTAREPGRQRMDLIAQADLDRAAASRKIPALIKGYLRMGGFVGAGAFIDHAFNTTDICLVVDVARIPARHRGFYAQGLRG